jgi:hypothetical protein
LFYESFEITARWRTAVNGRGSSHTDGEPVVMPAVPYFFCFNWSDNEEMEEASGDAWAGRQVGAEPI